MRCIEADVESPNACFRTDEVHSNIKSGGLDCCDISRLVVDETNLSGDRSRHAITEERVQSFDTGRDDVTGVRTVYGVLDFQVIEVDGRCQPLDPVGTT